MSHLFLRFLWSASLLWFATASLTAQGDDSRRAMLGFTSGSAIQAEVLSTDLSWRDLSPGSNAEFRRIPLGDVELLLMAPQARTRMVSRIKILVEQLGDPDFRNREAAEAELKQLPNEQISALLTTATNSPSAEIAVRARRILSGRTPKPVNPDQFDWIKLTNGQILRGDAGEFEIEVRFHGKSLSLTRDQINAVSFSPAAQTTLGSALVNGPTSSRIAAWEPNPSGLVEIDFDRDYIGQERENATNANELFVFQGIRLASEIPGNIGIRTIPLESEKFGVGVRGICVFDRRNPDTVSIFRGVTRMEFCQPGLAGLSSGVRRLGLVASTIDFPRDLILQAFNSDGHLLAQVEANEPKFAYFGLEAPEPIALIRVLSNPYLTSVTRKVDETYLIDGLKISNPERVTPASAPGETLITLRSGDLFVGGNLTFSAEGACQLDHPELGLSLSLKTSELESVVFAKSTPVRFDPKSNRWFALLADRTVIEVQVGAEFTVNRLGNSPLDRNRIVALWNNRDFLRHPLDGDLDSNRTALVFPTCRIVCDDLALSESGYSWGEGNPQTSLQPVKLPQTSQGEVPDENPAPQFTRLDWNDPKESQIPTIWFSQPPLVNPRLGFVSLRNGEQLAFGDGAEFQFQSIDASGVKLKHAGERELLITWSEVWRLKLPADPSRDSSPEEQSR